MTPPRLLPPERRPAPRRRVEGPPAAPRRRAALPEGSPVPPAELWADVFHRMPLEEAAHPHTPVPIGQRRRRGFDAQATDGRAEVSLVRDDEGLLRWLYTPPAAPGGNSRRAYRAFTVDRRSVVQSFRFSDLGRNEITGKLVDLDAWLTPGAGMKRWTGAELIDCPRPDIAPNGAQRTLLLVHGTFSESAMWFKELGATDNGRALLRHWEDRYPHILAFNHPTLSVGAWSNAIDLARELRGVKTPLDVVCHSRGGLVLSWLLRMQPVPVERAVFVGSPLVGTSLAAPDRLRAGLDMLANYAELVAGLGQAVAPVMPIASGVAGLSKILGKALRLGSGLPVVDAAVALVPGLATQQHVANNLDLRQLFADDWLTQPDLSGIGVAFQPDESREPAWKFWRRFSHLFDQAKYAAADLVFNGPNDLVVDVDSMFRLGEGRHIAFENLGTSPTLHHTNYFRDARVLDYLERRLG